MKRDFIPQSRAKIDSWEQNFIKGITAYAAQLGFDAAQLTAITDQVNTHREAYREAQLIKSTAKSKIKAMQEEQLRTVQAIRKVVRQAKASPGYTETMGRSMGIIGPEDETELTRPVLKVKLDAQLPVIRFRKGQRHGVIIYSRRGDEKELTLLAIATRSPYVDRRPNLDPTMPEERHYAALYMHHDHPTGEMSAMASITLGKG